MMLRAVSQFFLSIKTAFGLFLAFIIITFLGSMSLVSNLAFFSGIDDAPLFKWMAGVENQTTLWWIYALIVLLAVLALNTILCTAEGLIKRISRKHLILKLSPQVMHIGVLFIMLGHLLTASMGYRTDLQLKKGETHPLISSSIQLDDISVTVDENGYETDWEAIIAWKESDSKTERRVLRPVKPVYFGQTGIYFKSVNIEPEPAAVIRVSKDPGALWALLGGVLLMIGGMGFLWGKFGEEP